MERIERFKEKTFAHFEELTGLTFDRDTGKCTTPGKVKMEGKFKEKWTAVCEQLGGQHDPQRLSSYGERPARCYAKLSSRTRQRTDS
jgi:hypothetical protein